MVYTSTVNTSERNSTARVINMMTMMMKSPSVFCTFLLYFPLLLSFSSLWYINIDYFVYVYLTCRPCVCRIG